MCFFSINPAVLKSQRHLTVLESVPIDQLLTESDGPVKFDGKQGSPALMPFLCKEIVKLLNIEEEQFLMTENGQDYIASAIYRALRDYKNIIEARNMIAQINSSNHFSDAGNFSFDSTQNRLADGDSLANTNSTEKGTDDVPLKIVKRNPNIIFKVQVSASTNPVSLDSDIFEDFSDVREYYMSDIYKYAVGNKQTYDEIVNYSKWVRNRFPDAFIIAVKNGKIIPLSKALKESKSNN